jgi:hypothetical protein
MSPRIALRCGLKLIVRMQKHAQLQHLIGVSGVRFGQIRLLLDGLPDFWLEPPEIELRNLR